MSGLNFYPVRNCASTKIDTINEGQELKIFLKMALPFSDDEIENQDIQWTIPDGNLFLKENIFD